MKYVLHWNIQYFLIVTIQYIIKVEWHIEQVQKENITCLKIIEQTISLYFVKKLQQLTELYKCADKQNEPWQPTL